MIKTLVYKYPRTAFVSHNKTIREQRHNVISQLFYRFSNKANNNFIDKNNNSGDRDTWEYTTKVKRKKKYIRTKASKQKSKDQKLLVDRVRQNCSASLNLLGEMAILETVQPSRYNQNTFIEGLNNARYFFEQVTNPKDKDVMDGNNSKSDQKEIQPDTKIMEKFANLFDFTSHVFVEDVDTNEKGVGFQTMHYRNSRYMLGVLDIVQGISMAAYDINKVTTLSVNQALVERSFSYFNEAAKLGQADAIFLLSYFYHKG